MWLAYLSSIASVLVAVTGLFTILEMTKAREQAAEPHVVVSHELKRGSLRCLAIQNFGGSPAYECSVSPQWAEEIELPIEIRGTVYCFAGAGTRAAARICYRRAGFV